MSNYQFFFIVMSILLVAALVAIRIIIKDFEYFVIDTRKSYNILVELFNNQRDINKDIYDQYRNIYEAYSIMSKGYSDMCDLLQNFTSVAEERYSDIYEQYNAMSKSIADINGKVSAIHECFKPIVVDTEVEPFDYDFDVCWNAKKENDSGTATENDAKEEEKT